MTKKRPEKSDRKSHGGKKKKPRKKRKKKPKKKRKKKPKKRKEKETQQKNNLLKYFGVIFIIGIIITASYFLFFYNTSDNPEVNDSSTNVTSSFTTLYNQTLTEIEASSNYVYEYQTIYRNNREKSLEISVSGNRYYSEYEDQTTQYESYSDGQYVYYKRDDIASYREVMLENQSQLLLNDLQTGSINIENHNFKLKSKKDNTINGVLKNLDTHDEGNLSLTTSNGIITSMTITDLTIRSPTGNTTTIIKQESNLSFEMVNIQEPEWTQSLRQNHPPNERVPLQELN